MRKQLVENPMVPHLWVCHFRWTAPAAVRVCWWPAVRGSSWARSPLRIRCSDSTPPAAAGNRRRTPALTGQMHLILQLTHKYISNEPLNQRDTVTSNYMSLIFFELWSLFLAPKPVVIWQAILTFNA